MGRAGKALKQVLNTYDISQNKLAVTMGVGRSNIHRWVNGTTDPVAEAVLEIRRGLQKINSEAAVTFIYLYLDDSEDNEEG